MSRGTCEMPHRVRQKFLRRIQHLEFTRARMEQLHTRDIIVQRDIDSVYEALFLRAVVSFEAFLEDLFFAILSGRAKYARGRIRLRMKASNAEALRDILLQGDKYMEWLPFPRTEERARLYLHDGQPFTAIDDGAKSTLKTITTIRNAIAHSSDHAIDQFNKLVVGNQALLPSEKRPSGYLR